MVGDDVALIAPLALLAALALLLALLAAWLWRSRALALKSKREEETDKSLKTFLHSVAYHKPCPAPHQRSIADAREMAFVVTDIEGSTQLSVTAPQLYDQLLEIHDQLMREGIAKFNG